MRQGDLHRLVDRRWNSCAAPPLPHLTKRRFDVRRVLLAVHERRRLHPLPQAAAERGQPAHDRRPSRAAISTYCSGVRAISSVRPRFERMLTPPRPTAVRPARVMTGTPIQSASSVLVWPLYGNGIEGEIEVEIAAEIRDSAGPRDEFATRVAGDAHLLEERADRLTMTAGGRLQDQPRAGQRLEDRPPELQGRPGDLDELIQAAEGDETVALGRQGRRPEVPRPGAERSRSNAGAGSSARCSRRRSYPGGRDRDRSGDSPSWPGRWWPAGRAWSPGRAPACGRRPACGCRPCAAARSTRMSIRSARMRSASWAIAQARRCRSTRRPEP